MSTTAPMIRTDGDSAPPYSVNASPGFAGWLQERWLQEWWE